MYNYIISTGSRNYKSSKLMTLRASENLILKISLLGGNNKKLKKLKT